LFRLNRRQASCDGDKGLYVVALVTSDMDLFALRVGVDMAYFVPPPSRTRGSINV
jgi:hypothetical protein